MRNIKFRAWYKTEEKMYGVVVFDFDKKQAILDRELDALGYWHKDIDIMQFTGFCDKNRKEIYEGDIVCFDNTIIGGSKIIGEVIFNTDNTLSRLEYGLMTKYGYQPCNFLGEIEVIGNIYENENLIGKK